MSSTPINKETKIYLSLSKYPGNFGTRFFNTLFSYYEINAIYKACQVRRGTLKACLNGFRALGISGGGVSMPYKEEAVRLVDSADKMVYQIGALNTIIRKKNGTLYGINTDYFAARKSIHRDNRLKTVVLGSGGAAKAACAALRSAHYRNVIVVSRNLQRAKHLAGIYQFHAWNWKRMSQILDVRQLINGTPFGMAGHAELKIPNQWLSSLKHIVDLPIGKNTTALIRMARTHHISCVEGAAFSLEQAACQFKAYTGIVVSTPTLKKLKLIAR